MNQTPQAKPPRLHNEGFGKFVGTTRDGRYTVTTTKDSIDRALADLRLTRPATPEAVVLDPSYWVRTYATPTTVWTHVSMRGIECVITRAKPKREKRA